MKSKILEDNFTISNQEKSKQKTRKKGVFIVFEGGDFCGKSTILKKVEKQLQKKFELDKSWLGYEGVVTSFEPGGGSETALAIREIILNPPNQKRLNELTEAFLFAASRNENVTKLILPNLQNKKIVITDRFVDSSFVYQGLLTDLGYELVNQINQLVLKDLKIDLTFYFEIDFDTWNQRVLDRKQTQEFNHLDKINFEKLKTNYQKIYQLKDNKKRKVIFIDGSKPIDNIVDEIINHIEKFGLTQ
ncbi:dTMP kinase [Mycoplasmoides fastidiosum]|uniref:Thymidylate kinase n=1 Tax=Mycoplasmoides fastidiosum TaxID=92758 RepID=A0ABU0LYN6_9BACT|nr:dTMP kinase [Mycoplasmoides fastidiosum]MDQ0513821.1 dTMP kinase [Mycoplasmoides fastidiosum]UUD37762.1 dTMP kinase [Mycoplasmoides fastidiosum]